MSILILNTGSSTLRISDITRNQQQDEVVVLDSGSGTVVLSLRRAPLVSPELAITLKVCRRYLESIHDLKRGISFCDGSVYALWLLRCLCAICAKSHSLHPTYPSK